MNMSTIQIDKNQHLVMHENRNISIVTSNTDKIEEILEKENQFEYLGNKRKELRQNLKNNEFKNLLANVSMFAGMSLIFFLFNSTMPITAAIITTVLTYMPVKLLHVGIFDIKSCRKSKKRSIEKEINEINSYLPILRKEINEIKKDTKFKKITMIPKENKNNDYSVTKISNYLYNCNETQNKKVLKMGQKTK